MGSYTLTSDSESARAAEWTYRTTLDPVLSAPRSRVIAVAMLRHAREHGYEDVFLSEWRVIRAEWMRSRIVLQRHWQQRIRRTSRARHHDSVSIREKYVRLTGE